MGWAAAASHSLLQSGRSQDLFAAEGRADAGAGDSLQEPLTVQTPPILAFTMDRPSGTRREGATELARETAQRTASSPAQQCRLGLGV